MGNITGRTTEQGSHTYGYDPIYQLTQATHPVLPQEAYAYDKTGNRQTSTSGAQETGYTHNANNELTEACIVDPASCTTYQHDANGNTTQKIINSQITNYVHNSRDRLERVELPDGRVAVYKYDPFGRRISKQVGAVITYFVYSDEGLIGEYDASGAPVKAYGWMPDSIWGTNPVFMVENGQYYYYHNDHLGTPQSMTDSTGNVVWSAEYAAFGEAMIDPASTITNNLRFPGQYYDEETGLHYNLNRYYDPVTGRYIQVDPIGFVAGDVNLYRYVNSNPILIIDPYGLHKIVICKNNKQLVLYDDKGKELFKANVVTGCEGKTDTPEGTFKAGTWQYDKKNDEYKTRWSEDHNANPYGPWFLPLYDKKGNYTTIGIHGTRGDEDSDMVAPPIVIKSCFWFGSWFNKDLKYVYCSHGCNRLSNKNIIELHNLLPNAKGTEVIIKESCD